MGETTNMPPAHIGTRAADGRPAGNAMRGFVLANIRAGSETEFFRALGDFQQVLRVYYLFDEYDYMLEVEGPTPEELVKTTRSEIRHLPGVERTAIFIEGNLGMFTPVERPAPENKVGVEPGFSVF